MTQPYSTVSVIGLGTTGSAIVELLARNDVRVVAVEVDDAALARGRARVERLTADDAALGRITYTAHLDEVAEADLVVEALPEALELKCDVLRRVDAACRASAVFVTTTTALSVTAIGAVSGRLARTVGLHLADPGRGETAELVTTPVTDPAVRDGVRELLCHLGRKPVPVPDRTGFVGGALLLGYLNDAAAMYGERYATRDDIDTAMMLGCGLPSGPLAQLDAIGLDVAYDSLRIMHERSGRRRYAPAPVLAEMVAGGLLGRKTGRGFYPYDGAADPTPIGGRTAGELARPVRRVGVVGSGTMAAGIAEVCARAGYPTVLAARTDVRAKEALAAVERSQERAVRRGKATPAGLAETMARLTGVSHVDGLGDCDLVIEALVEDLAVKRERFRELDRVCRPGTVFASTTSSLPVTACAAATSRPQDVLGMHFFNPAPVMKLVELVRTDLTSPQSIGTVRAFCSALGKRTVDCTDRTGFIVNALLFPYLNHAITMLEDGFAGAGDIDTVMTKGLEYPLGPFQLLDVVGLDVSHAIQLCLHAASGVPDLAPAPLLDQLVRAGYLGRKVGRGFHAHERR